MSETISLSRITVFPIKALPGHELEAVSFTPAGALQFDRQFALFDHTGAPVNGKRHPEVNQLSADYDLNDENDIQVTLDIKGFDSPERFKLQQGNAVLIEWLSDFFGFTVQLFENRSSGFPDDTKRSGPTLVSTASLEMVTSWFPALDLEEIRKRFRSNLEIEGCPAFWEDQLSLEPDVPHQFQLGEVQFAGLKHCVRCPVPTQDTNTGQVMPEFQSVFMQRRAESLPEWVNESMYDHMYSLAINTQILRRGGSLSLGNKLALIS